MNEIFKKFRSVRKYQTRYFPLETVKEIIAEAGQAPSGLNKQPWKYYIVKDPEVKQRIRKESEKVENEFYREINKERKKEFEDMKINIRKPFLTDAPYLVIAFCDCDAPYTKESLWISVGWFLLSVTMKGLNTLTYTPYKMDFLNKILNMPETFIPQVILPLGYGEKKGKKSRKAPEDIIEIF